MLILRVATDVLQVSMVVAGLALAWMMSDARRPARAIDLSGYLIGGDPTDPPAPVSVDESLRLRIVRPPVLQPAPGPGLCRRPAEGPVAGYVVNRTAAVAGELDEVDEDGDGPAWSAGDTVDVYPVRGPSRACGRCWACRLPRVARAVELVGRAVVLMPSGRMAALRSIAAGAAAAVVLVLVFDWSVWLVGVR